jgi:RNA polymerase sigma-70 factor (ECF subfamily)
MQAVTDEQLIRWVASGDSSCLATLFERHHKGVYRFCLQMTRNRTQSEDLVQDVFIRVLRKADAYRGEGSFKAWLYHIARNVTLDQLRRAGVAGEAFDESLDAADAIDTRSAEQVASGRELVGQVAEALARLPAAAREIIWLGRFEFDSYEELGLALGCKPGAARVRMHRAMRLLATEIGVPMGDLTRA